MLLKTGQNSLVHGIETKRVHVLLADPDKPWLLLFDVYDGDGILIARDLTPRQVDDLATQRGATVVPHPRKSS